MMSSKQSRIERLLEQRGLLVDNELSLLSVRVEPPELAEVVRYALALRGKKVRASLLTLSCEAVGGSLSRALIPAVVVEMVHNTSLILDDVIDASDLRRGRKTINARWGNNMALIACDAMLALAIREAVRADIKLTSVDHRERLRLAAQARGGRGPGAGPAGLLRWPTISTSPSARRRRCSARRPRPARWPAGAARKKWLRCATTASVSASLSRYGTTCSTSSRTTVPPASPG